VLQDEAWERVGGSRTVHVDLRVLAATTRQRDLALDAGTFREALSDRLHVFPLTLPPLRERLDDLPGHAHPWPGNIRELEHVIERAGMLAHGSAWPLDDFLLTRRHAETLTGTPRPLAAVERPHIVRMLQAADRTIEGPGGAAL